MRVRAADHRRNDPALYFALAWTAAISFGLLLSRSSPDPLLLLPVAMAALPLAAAPRHQVVARVLATLLLTGFLASRGTVVEGLLFVPAIGAMLLSAYRRFRGEDRTPSGRPRRTKRR